MLSSQLRNVDEVRKSKSRTTTRPKRTTCGKGGLSEAKTPDAPTKKAIRNQTTVPINTLIEFNNSSLSSFAFFLDFQKWVKDSNTLLDTLSLFNPNWSYVELTLLIVLPGSSPTYKIVWIS
jgi:hypothetical protein